MDKAPHILIVEDEPDLAGVLFDYLIANKFAATVINNGDNAEDWLLTNNPDLILLDLMLPGKSGLDICRDFRKTRDTPIIMVTAKVEEVDRLIGLELGADDYICKPYSPREVVARVKAVLKRTMNVEKTPANNFDVIKDSNKVIYQGQSIELTTVEMALFELLYSAPGRIFSRQAILENIYNDYRVVSDRTVDSHVKKLRKKIQTINGGEDVIHSVYGAGYKYEASN